MRQQRTREMDASEAIGLASSGRFLVQVEAVDVLAGKKIGIGHDFDHPSGWCFVYTLRDPFTHNEWRPLAGPFLSHDQARAFIDKLLPGGTS